jgi:hypothetical protein
LFYKKKRYQYIVLIFLVSIVTTSVFNGALESKFWENPLYLFGTRDLIAFWGGINTYFSGGNPYDLEQLLIIQRTQQPWLKEPQFFLNPPWAITLLYPFRVLPFQISNVCMIFGCLIALATNALIVRSWTNKKNSKITAIFSGILSIATLNHLWVGQLTILVLTSVILSLHAIKNKKFILAGVLLVFVSLKPHLFILFLLYLALWSYKEKNYKVVISLVLTFALVNLPLIITSSSIYYSYVNKEADISLFRTSSTADLCREIYFILTGDIARKPKFVIPLIGVILGILIWRKNSNTFTWEKNGALVLATSILVSPYSWIYDQVMLLPLQTLLVCNGNSRTIRVLCFFQILILSVGLFTNTLFYYFWVPWLYLLYYFCVTTKQRQTR